MRALSTKPSTISPDSDFPYGRVKDRAGSVPGTRVNELLVGDIIQFFEKLMADAVITPNGLPDNAYSGFQLNEALRALILLITRTTIYNYTTTIFGGTQLAVTIPTNNDKNASYMVTMVARKIIGAGNFENAWYKQVINVKNIAGVITSTQDTVYARTDGSSSPVLTITTSGANVLLNVTPGSGYSHNCIFYVEKTEI